MKKSNIIKDYFFRLLQDYNILDIFKKQSDSDYIIKAAISKLKMLFLTYLNIVPGYPIYYNIELTNYCNLDCPMCLNHLIKRKKGFMEFSLFKKIIDELALSKEFIHLRLHFDGEPLMHPKILEFVKYAKLKNIPILALSTNGYLLTEDIARGLIESGIDRIAISFDGGTKKTYESIRVNSNFERVIKNVKKLVEIRDSLKRKKPYIQIQTIVMEQTKDELPKVMELWNNVVDRVNVVNVDTRGGVLTENKRVVDDKEVIENMPCKDLWYKTVIYCNGDMVPCTHCGDAEIVFGNVKKQSIKSIWLGKKLERFRKLHLRGKKDKIKFCKKCDMLGIQNLDLKFVLKSIINTIVKSF